MEDPDVERIVIKQELMDRMNDNSMDATVHIDEVTIENDHDYGRDITEEEHPDGEVSKRPVGEEKRFWLPSETDTFLRLIEENYAKFFSPHKKSVFWNMISKKLEQENIFLDSQVIQCKWRNMLRTYRTCVAKNNFRPARFRHFNKMHNIMGKHKYILDEDDMQVEYLDEAITVYEPEVGTSNLINVNSVNESTPIRPMIKKKIGSEILPPKKIKVLDKSMSREYIEMKRLYLKQRNEMYRQHKQQVLNIKREKLSLYKKKIELYERRVKVLERIASVRHEEQFRKCYCISQETKNFILNLMAEKDDFHFEEDIPRPGKRPNSTEKCLLMTLSYLSNQETFKEISRKFGTAMSAGHRCISKVVKFLVDISPQFIKWPSDEDGEVISNEFLQKYKINGTIGVIGNVHIPIRKPSSDQDIYTHAPGKYSIILQGVVDSRNMFIDISTGDGGSSTSKTVLEHSDLYQKTVRTGTLPGNKYIIGNSSYPSLNWLLSMDSQLLFQDVSEESNPEVTRVATDVFRLLKRRFHRLKFFENLNIQFINECTVAACVIHNICVMCKDSTVLPEDFDDEND